MYSVMWSEHCSYKSSRPHLGRFPTEAPWVLVGPGEGAGVIDVGDGVAVAVRIESHNHPSAVEPYQGAATGVGGIIRDIFSMGARPIALMDPLRFGPLDDPRTRYLFEGVVSGISGYGNAVGVPTVGGELVFDECYRDNPLVNVFCLGTLPIDRLVLARAEGVDNLAVLLGASTGRDGIGGASVLASAGFEEGSEAKRPSVQVGDPFEEKKLIEACLALLDAGLAIGVQDLGAAGISCAASETAAKTGAGHGRRRRPGAAPRAGHEPGGDAHVREPGADAGDRHAGAPRRGPRAVRTLGDPRVGDRPGHRHRPVPGLRRALRRRGRAGREPGAGARRRARRRCRRTARRSPTCRSAASATGRCTTGRSPGPPITTRASRGTRPSSSGARFPAGTDLAGELLALLGSPNIADPAWVYRQYDHQLFLNTVVGPGGDASVLRLRDAPPKALALSVDGNARFCALEPRTGGRLAVLEAARNVACTGAAPKALVNCLNFGNPEHPEVMWQFSEVVDGMSEACAALGLPVIGGNVSFYNESRGADIDPTPVVGVIGLIDELTDVPPPARLRDGDAIVVLGATRPELGGSSWATMHGLRDGAPPAADLDGGGAAARARRRARHRADPRRSARLLRRRARGRARGDGDPR